MGYRKQDKTLELDEALVIAMTALEIMDGLQLDETMKDWMRRAWQILDVWKSEIQRKKPRMKLRDESEMLSSVEPDIDGEGLDFVDLEESY